VSARADLERYHRLRAAGMCGSCGRLPAEPERSRCGDCLHAHRTASRKTQRRYERSGLCRACGNDMDRQGVLCVGCLRRRKENRKNGA